MAAKKKDQKNIWVGEYVKNNRIKSVQIDFDKMTRKEISDAFVKPTVKKSAANKKK